MKNSDLFISEGDFPDFNQDGAVEHLRHAVRFKTTSYVDVSKIDYGQFDAFHHFLRTAYPRVFGQSEVETVGYSLLIRIPGEDASLRPALFMAHQDVVPVVPGTEQNWQHGPFSGDLSDGYIWGRGTLDIKEMLIGILESAEYLISQGRHFKRTVYLAFGEDEESRSQGAARLAALLESRGIELEFVWDEGSGDVSDAADYGAPGTLICPIGVFEKGYADMRIRVHSQGGHSSNPFNGTSLGALARAIDRIVSNPPKPHLAESDRETLHALQPLVTDARMKAMLEDIPSHERELIHWYLNHESLYHLVQTTIAPTMISGGSSAGNVMPQDMEAVINFRLTPFDTPESLLEHCQALVGPEAELSYVQCVGASIPSDTSAYGYQALVEVLHHYFDRLVFLPLQNRGYTDSRQYERVCRCVLRFGPFLEEEDISNEGIHGTNERISVRAFLQGIRVIIRMMDNTCCSY